MKTYEELLSDIEDDIELMGASHIVYSMEENNIITDYDYLPSDSCNISTTLKDLQENIRQQMLYAKVSGHLAAADKTAPKLAVIFPGIGYTADKPLLYYTSRLARKHGYQIQTVSYGTLPENIKGDSVKMRQAFDLALAQTEESLRDIDWISYGSILFISKSIGTAISSAYAALNIILNAKISCLRHWQTPSPSRSPGSIAFRYRALPIRGLETGAAIQTVRALLVHFFSPKTPIIPLETGDIQTDLSILKTTMGRVERFIIN